jgi:hypothetical protein
MVYSKVANKKDSLPDHVLKAVNLNFLSDNELWDEGKIHVVYQDRGDTLRDEAAEYGRSLVKKTGVRYDWLEIRTEYDDTIFIIFEDNFE